MELEASIHEYTFGLRNALCVDSALRLGLTSLIMREIEGGEGGVAERTESIKGRPTMAANQSPRARSVRHIHKHTICYILGVTNFTASINIK